MILDNKLLQDNLLRFLALISLHTSGTFMFQKWGISRLQTYRIPLVSCSAVREENKIQFKQLSFWFLKTSTSISTLIFRFFRNGAGRHTTTYAISKCFLCTYRWWKQEGGRLDRQSDCKVSLQTVICCGQDSPWLCLSACEAPVCSSVDQAVQGSPLLQTCHSDRDRLTHCSTERSQPSICLFFPSIHSFMFLCFSHSTSHSLSPSSLCRSFSLKVSWKQTVGVFKCVFFYHFIYF